MFPAMRRSRQALSARESEEILQRASAGVLAVAGAEGYPYAVPLNFVYADGKLYFHSAREGHKLDALRRCPKASFCVVDEDRVVPQEYTSYFRSVIAFGTVRELTDEAEKRAAIETLARKYAPEADPADTEAEITRYWAPLCMLEMRVDCLTGKQAKELAAGLQR